MYELNLHRHHRLNLCKVDELEEEDHKDLQLGNVLEQVDRLVFLMVNEQEIVFFDLITHQEKNEGEECANRHGN